MDKSAPSLPSGQILRIWISANIRQKLESKHNVKPQWIAQCFQDTDRKYLIDRRESHRTSPETQWFIAEYEPYKLLKICFIYFPERKALVIKTAYPPCAKEVEIYQITQEPLGGGWAAPAGWQPAHTTA